MPENLGSDFLLFHLAEGTLFLAALPGPFPSMLNTTFFEKLSHVFGGEAESFLLLLFEAPIVLPLRLLDNISVLFSNELKVFIELGLLHELLSDGNLDLLHREVCSHNIFELEPSNFHIWDALYNFISQSEVLDISAHYFHRLHLG